jgi:hypothetical protein
VLETIETPNLKAPHLKAKVIHVKTAQHADEMTKSGTSLQGKARETHSHARFTQKKIDDNVYSTTFVQSTIVQIR